MRCHAVISYGFKQENRRILSGAQFGKKIQVVTPPHKNLYQYFGARFLQILIPALVFGFVLHILTSKASAQSCTFTNANLNFGSIDLTGGSSFNTTATFNANCTGTPGNRIRVCANVFEGTGGLSGDADPRHMLSGANSLNFNIFKNAAYSNIWGARFWAHSPRHKSFRLRLNGAGVKSKNITMRSRIYAGQPATAPGFYTSIFSGAHTAVYYAYNGVGNCSTIIGLGGGVQVPFTASATVLASCTVSAGNMNFGSSGVLTSNKDASNTIAVQCTNTTPYNIGLDGGLTGAASPTTRKMASGPNQVTYGIFRDAARTLPWGDTIGTNTQTGTGNGATQNFTAYGRVSPQSTPPSGTYSDTIVVTVTY